MSTDNLVADGFPFLPNQSRPHAPTNGSMDFFDFAQLGSGNNSVEGFDMSMAQNDPSMNAFTMPSASSGVPVASSTTSEPALDWNNFDWAAVTTVDDTQPALTYASSNTHSEFGEHTPPEEIDSLFSSRNFMRSMQQMTTNVDHAMQPVAGLEQSADSNQSNSQTNRWSLPPSFWTGPTVTATNGSTENMTGGTFDWTTSPQTIESNPFELQTNTLARSNTSASVGPPRAKAVYDRSNTLPSDPGWERLLQQYQAGELWGDDNLATTSGQTETMNNSVSTPPVKAPLSASTVDNSEQQAIELGMLQPTDGEQQFFLNPDAMVAFDFNGDFATPGYTNGAWPQ